MNKILSCILGSCEEQFVILKTVYGGFEDLVLAEDTSDYFNIFDKIDITERYPNAREEYTQCFLWK